MVKNVASLERLRARATELKDEILALRRAGDGSEGTRYYDDLVGEFIRLIDQINSLSTEADIKVEDNITYVDFVQGHKLYGEGKENFALAMKGYLEEQQKLAKDTVDKVRVETLKHKNFNVESRFVEKNGVEQAEKAIMGLFRHVCKKDHVKALEIYRNLQKETIR